MMSLIGLKRITGVGIFALSCASPAFAACVDSSSTLMSVDSDADGIPDPIEALEGRSFCIKDNDIFNKYPLFVKQAYRDFFAREAEASAVAYWDGLLVSDAQTRPSLVETFMGTGEFQAKAAPITRLYKAYFNRMPDHEGLWYWVALFGNGKNLADIAQTFSQSPEFKAQYGSVTNDAFIDLVYQNVLGRAGDADGKAYWLNLLTTGKQSRGEIMIGFSESVEHVSVSSNHVNLVLAYEGLLRRNVNASDYAAAMTRLRGGVSIGTILTELIESTEYQLRFMPLSGKVFPTPTGALNDTGAIFCLEAGRSYYIADNVGCNSVAALALSHTQDGMIGRDANAATNSEIDGRLGFSYTKIDSNGNALPATATSWSCIKDNVTGFIWENKTDDGGLHDGGNRYTNIAGDMTARNALGFVNAVNLEGWCGANDWTIPTIQELLSIVDYGKSSPEFMVDTNYFSNMLLDFVWAKNYYSTDDTSGSWIRVFIPVWSASKADADHFWAVNFNEGYEEIDIFSKPLPVRLVRAH